MQSSKRCCSVAIALALIFLCNGGCAEKQASAPPAPPPVSKTPPPAARPVRDEEATEFQAAMLDALFAGDVQTLNQNFFDWDAFLESASAGIFDSPELAQIRATAFAQAKTAMVGENGLAAKWVAAAAESSSIAFLRLRTIDGKQRLLLRFGDEQNGVQYFDLVLTRNPRGRPRIVDVLSYGSGEFLSQKTRLGYLWAVAQVAPKSMEALSPREGAFVESYKTIAGISRAYGSGDFEQVLSLYDSLPPLAQQDSTLAALWLLAAKRIGDARYLEIAEDFQTRFPNDPTLGFVGLNAFVLNQEYDEALAMIDRMEETVGEDPYLNVVRSDVSILSERFQQAQEFADKAIARDPTLEDAYWVKVTAALKGKDFDAVNATLQEIEKVFMVEFGDVTASPDFQDFVKSKQYKSWIKRHEEQQDSAASTETPDSPVAGSDNQQAP